MKTNCPRLSFLLIGLLLSLGGTANAAPFGTAFTYQGRLADGTNAANNFYDLDFALFDAPAGGSQLGLNVTYSGYPVSNGLFTVALDFGASQFKGDARWLQIQVRTNGGLTTPYTPLTPRQALTASPYALYALNVGTPVQGSNIVSGTVNSNALDVATQAQLALAGSGGNSVANTNGVGIGTALANPTTTGVVTNLAMLQYPEPGTSTLTVDPTPNVYWLSGLLGTNINAWRETNLLALIDYVGSNGVPYGENYIQMDAGWSGRDSAGNLIFNTNVFTHTGAWICDYAHQRGVRIGGFICDNCFSREGISEPGASFLGHEEADMWMMATNFVMDGIKTDAFDPLVCSILYSTGRPFYRQCSYPAYAYPGAKFGMSPLVPKYYNSVYMGFGLPDTSDGLSFRNIYNHFVAELNTLSYIQPGFYGEGVGWVQTFPEYQYGADSYDNVLHLGMDLATMTCSRLLLCGGSCLTNREFLEMYRDAAVIPAKTIITNYTGGATNYVLVRQLGAIDSGVKALCFVNASASTQAMTITSSQLGLGATFTLRSPWFHSIEGWATNSWTVDVPPTNTVLYRVSRGISVPDFHPGTNYLSDQPWRSGMIAPHWTWSLFRDMRDNGAALQIGSTTYSKGLSIGYPLTWDEQHFQNTSVEYSLGKQASSFTTDFGLQSPYTGGPGALMLQVWTNGVLQFQSGYVTNTAQATNITLSMVGVDSLKLITVTNGAAVNGGNAVGGCLGNCYVTVPGIAVGPDGGATLAGTMNATAFVGDGSGLSNLNPSNLTNGTAGISITGNAATATSLAGVSTSNIISAATLITGNFTSVVCGYLKFTNGGTVYSLVVSTNLP
jgi:hypothetical protein